MLITHHSVMPEKLPVALLFVHWNILDWNPKQAYNSVIEERRNSAYSKISDTDENRNFEFYRDQ
uniref:Uncharacterized protein n=1 Tax=Heterorhabditis bacteriophora TaxID=37862 RepID=A0A1I7X9F9_HETBA